jgi:hypothetical protein
MPVTAIKSTRKVASRKKRVVVNKNMKDLSNDPFFVKKAKAAEAFLKKHGLPAELSK